MKNKLIALALIIVMLFALSACGEKEEPAQTVEPAVEESETPVEEVQPAEVVETVDPLVTPVGVEPNSGVHTITSDINGISFDYDSKFVAMQNPVGNITVFAGDEASIPYCIVSLISDTDAESYLKDMISASEIELGKALVTKAEQPEKVTLGDRDVYYIYYTFADKDAGGNVACAYYAEQLDSGDIVVYNYSALEGQTADVEEIAKLAIQTFSIAV